MVLRWYVARVPSNPVNPLWGAARREHCTDIITPKMTERKDAMSLMKRCSLFKEILLS